MTMFNDGSHVDEIFASDFKTIVNGIAKQNEPVSFKLNVQNGEGAHLLGNHAYAYEYLEFMDALETEVSAHGVAIVVATDYKTDVHDTTVFVVCDD